MTTAPPDRVSVDGNDAHVTRHIIGPTGVTFTVQVRINFYQHQSSAMIARWDGTEWKKVAELRGKDLTTWSIANGHRAAKNFGVEHVEADIRTLITEASFITNGLK